MVYLDYSATTPVNREVLDSFEKVALEYMGNPNSIHKLGIDSKHLLDQATEQIAHLLGVKPNEIIYCSDATEANNLAIKGIAFQYQNRGKHIITTLLEHASLLAPLQFLQQHGFEIDFVNVKEDGTIDLEHLKSLLREDTILVTISAVSSELGLCQPISEIGAILKEFPKCFFHVDLSQSIGKINIPLDMVDLANFSAHKIYGLKGIACFVKKDPIKLQPLIHGGKSTTVYRAGTPPLPLIVSMAKALRLSLAQLEENYAYVKTINIELVSFLKQYSNVFLNCNENTIPYVINFSIPKVRPETFVHALEQHDIIVGTQTACSNPNFASKSVLAFTKDEEKAKSSIRLSLSSLTTKEEIELFKKAFDLCYRQLGEGII